MKQLWSPQELDDFWLLTDEEVAFCTSAYTGGRLALALQLKYLEHEGRFPRHRGELSETVIAFVAKQVGTSPDSLADYDWGGRTTRRHRADIRERLGFRKAILKDAANLKAHMIRRWHLARLIGTLSPKRRCPGIENSVSNRPQAPS